MALQKRQFILLNATGTKVSWNIVADQLVIFLIHLIKCCSEGKFVQGLLSTQCWCHKFVEMFLYYLKSVKQSTKNSMIEAPNRCPHLRKGIAPAVVKGEHETPRFYVITDGVGKEYR